MISFNTHEKFVLDDVEDMQFFECENIMYLAFSDDPQKYLEMSTGCVLEQDEFHECGDTLVIIYENADINLS